MKKIKNIKYYIIILSVLIISGLFYWYEIRPSKIYAECNDKMITRAQNGSFKDKSDFDFAYKVCLRSKGLNN